MSRSVKTGALVLALLLAGVCPASAQYIFGGGGGLTTPVSVANGGTATTTTTNGHVMIASLAGAATYTVVANPLPVANGGTATTTTTNGYVTLTTLNGVATYTTVAVPIPVADGGTATAALTNGRLPYYNGTSLYDSQLSVGANTLTLLAGTFILGSGGGATRTFQTGNSADTLVFSFGGTPQQAFNVTVNGDIAVQSGGRFAFSSTTAPTGSTDIFFERASVSVVNVSTAAATPFGTIVASAVTSNGVNFSNLGSSRTPGTLLYCPTCTPATNPCTGGGTGTYAFRLGTGVWKCL